MCVWMCGGICVWICDGYVDLWFHTQIPPTNIVTQATAIHKCMCIHIYRSHGYTKFTCIHIHITEGYIYIYQRDIWYANCITHCIIAIHTAITQRLHLPTPTNHLHLQNCDSNYVNYVNWAPQRVHVCVCVCVYIHIKCSFEIGA